MSHGLPNPPTEPAITRGLDDLAPKFAAAVARVIADLEGQGYQPIVSESLRTDARQAWLYGFGRTWDDDRGVVTNASDASVTWHGYGLAVDIIDQRYEWNPSRENAVFCAALCEAAEAEELTSGQDWDHDHTIHRPYDAPHCQWWIAAQHVLSTEGKPSAHAQQLRAAGRLADVWAELHAA